KRFEVASASAGRTSPSHVNECPAAMAALASASASGSVPRRANFTETSNTVGRRWDKRAKRVESRLWPEGRFDVRLQVPMHVLYERMLSVTVQSLSRMKPRNRGRIAAVLLAAVVIAVGVANAVEPATTSAPASIPATPDQISQWIAELDSNKYL